FGVGEFAHSFSLGKSVEPMVGPLEDLPRTDVALPSQRARRGGNRYTGTVCFGPCALHKEPFVTGVLNHQAKRSNGSGIVLSEVEIDPVSISVSGTRLRRIERHL